MSYTQNVIALPIEPKAPVTNVDLVATPKLRVIVVGAGPVGIRFAQELLRKLPNAQVSVFSNEPYAPYNRVQLSAVLAGQIAVENITIALPNTADHPNFSHQINTISAIKPELNRVVDINGNEHSYDKLVIATGSRPHVPNIPGVEQTGVYTFRNLKDAEALYSRVSRSRHTVVVGGGLLGIEAARALLRFNTQVTLVQQAPRLMNRQLDAAAAAHLQAKIEHLGVQVITQSGVRAVHGQGRVTGVTLYSGQELECDTVLLCAGIKINERLARKAGIKISRGIAVDDNLATSVHDIYAIGECCEHEGETFGLVAPGFEQAAVLADHLAGGSAEYHGSVSVSRLKVVDEPVCSMGEVNEFGDRPFLKEVVHKKGDCYRKLVIHRGKIIGAVGIGEWGEAQRIQEAFRSGRRIWPWQLWRFRITGDAWGGGFGDDPNGWPASAVVCQCNGIDQGTLVSAVASGNDTLPKLQACTGAGTVCGSCKPLLNELVGYPSAAEAEKGSRVVQIFSLIALVIIAVIFFTPASQVADSYIAQTTFEKIWNDKYWKQVTGFTLLGLTTLGLTVSLRKRLLGNRLGDFAYWRILHITLGLACAAVLIFHTGFHLGANLNRLLILDFLAVLIMGSLAGLVVSYSHKFKASKSPKIRKTWTWLHILIAWPLPVLLLFHVLSVYYF